MIIVGAVNAASEFHVVKFSLSCLLDEEDGAYIYIYIYLFTIQTPWQYASIPRPEGNLVMLDNFIVSLANIDMPCLFIPHLCTRCILLSIKNQRG